MTCIRLTFGGMTGIRLMFDGMTCIRLTFGGMSDYYVGANCVRPPIYRYIYIGGTEYAVKRYKAYWRQALR